MTMQGDGSLSDRIRAVRKTLNETQEEFGRSLGVAGASVSQWETGDTAPSAEHLEAIYAREKTAHARRDDDYRQGFKDGFIAGWKTRGETDDGERRR